MSSFLGVPARTHAFQWLPDRRCVQPIPERWDVRFVQLETLEASPPLQNLLTFQQDCEKNKASRFESDGGNVAI